jgi:hypothetical protein
MARSTSFEALREYFRAMIIPSWVARHARNRFPAHPWKDARHGAGHDDVALASDSDMQRNNSDGALLVPLASRRRGVGKDAA